MITEILIGLIIFGVCRLFFGSKSSVNGKLPPGPRGLPIFGHLPLLGSNPPMKLIEWSKTYGPILYLRFGSMPTVVLNDAKIIREAFIKEEFAGRADLKLFVEASNKNGFALTDGPRQVEQRRFIITNLKDFGLGTSSMEYRVQEEMSKFFKKVNVTGKPQQINNYFRFPVINAIWGLVMGKRFNETDPDLAEFIHSVDEISDTSTVAAQMSMFIPWFGTWFGFLGYNRSLFALQNVYAYMAKQIESYKKTHIPGTAKDFTGVYLNKVLETTDPHSSFNPTINAQPVSTGDLFMAALDTSTKALDWLLIHMARNPDIQKKLQAEIDAVVGDSRTPSLSDRSRMPYCEAVIFELLRMSPTVPLGVSHRTLQDVELRGYTIPKNTMVISNIYGVQHDKDVWENPEEFIPDRFLDENGKLKKQNDFIPFGSGKRNCIGEAHAKDNIFLIGTSFLQKYSVSCSEKRPTIDIKLEIVLSPHPFELIIKERSCSQ